jgi:hypothetical protein
MRIPCLRLHAAPSVKSLSSDEMACTTLWCVKRNPQDFGCIDYGWVRAERCLDLLECFCCPMETSWAFQARLARLVK